MKSEEKSSDLQWLEDDIMQATMSVSQLDNEALEIIGLALLCLTKIFFQIMLKKNYYQIAPSKKTGDLRFRQFRFRFRDRPLPAALF